MVEQEWPAIKADIDAGNLALQVMGPQSGVGDIPGIKDALSHSHQVVAYAYSLDDASNLTLTVYDCNDHDNDSSTISLNIANPAHTITISAPQIQSRFTHPHPIRGIFRSDYSGSDPTRRDVNFPTLGSPSPATSPTTTGVCVAGQRAHRATEAAAPSRRTGKDLDPRADRRRRGPDAPTRLPLSVTPRLGADAAQVRRRQALVNALGREPSGAHWRG